MGSEATKTLRLDEKNSDEDFKVLSLVQMVSDE